ADESANLLSNEAIASLIVLYSLTILFSIAGNILVVAVFTKGRRCRTDIRPFLINLAVADLIMALFCMPFTFTFVMIRTWIFSSPMCPLVLFMQHLSVSASVFTNMAIGIDRFLVVTFPLRARMSSQRARYTLFIIWLCSLALSSVQLIVGKAKDKGSFVDCDEEWSSSGARRTFTMFVLLITYITPLIILAVTYSIVAILLWKRTAPGNAHEERDSQQLKAKRKVIKMLVLVVVMFGLCWLPLHTFFLVIDFNPHLMSNQTEGEERTFTVLFYTAFWLAMSNSCANPIIYGFTNESFRADMASLCYIWFPFCGCLKSAASRRLSISTNESVYKRSSTIRKSQSSYRQAVYRNGSKVFIEIRKDNLYRGRSSLNEFYQDSFDMNSKDSSGKDSSGKDSSGKDNSTNDGSPDIRDIHSSNQRSSAVNDLSIHSSNHSQRSSAVNDLSIHSSNHSQRSSAVNDLSIHSSNHSQRSSAVNDLSIHSPNHNQRSSAVNDLSIHSSNHSQRRSAVNDLSIHSPNHNQRSSAVNDLSIHSPNHNQRSSAVNDLSIHSPNHNQRSSAVNDLSIHSPNHNQRSSAVNDLSIHSPNHNQRSSAVNDLSIHSPNHNQRSSAVNDLSIHSPNHNQRSSAVNNLSIHSPNHNQRSSAVNDLSIQSSNHNLRSSAVNEISPHNLV
ncbi:pyroglutamylated RF-amide peptide receptor-like, partial [Physella acuta]|uniref:pyroglutamylated RF-amide peptide receptor-like n=1 Tax=Physella acuta TaxID=109671 RepID=UPI0027DE5040